MLGALLFAVAASAAPECHFISGDRITGRDLAQASPLLAAVAPDLQAGYAPAPGHRRYMASEEVLRLTGIAAGPFCFAWKMSSPSAEQMAAAMAATLGPEAKIEIVETSVSPVAEGEMIFPRTGLGAATANKAGTVLWRGYVRFAPNRRMDVWARARISVPFERLVTTEQIKVGEPIGENQILLEKGRGLPNAAVGLIDPAAVVGRVARRTLEANTPLLVIHLGPARDVQRGDTVNVEVHSGAAQLSLEAKAERTGAVGDTIPVRNLSSGRLFQARVESKGRVVVDTAPLKGTTR